MGFNRYREHNEGTDVCRENSMFRTNAGCECLADEMVSRVPNSYFLPIIGGLFFEPSQSESAQIGKAAFDICQRRFN